MISHHHQCIFVHIPKCGGQSVEAVFLEDLGISRKNSAPFWLLPNPNPNVGPPRLAHLSAHEYIDYGYVPEFMFQNYFKFTVVRNPWSRAVSLYRYSYYRCSFKSFISKIYTKPETDWWFLRPQIEFLEVNGKIAVDEVLRLEHLSQEFPKIQERLGLKANLQHLNIGKNQKSRLPWRRKEIHDRWQDYYDEDTWKSVSIIYERDIQAFDYNFS